MILVEGSTPEIQFRKEPTRLFERTSREARSWCARPRHRRLRTPSSRMLPSIVDRSPSGSSSSRSDRSEPSFDRYTEGDKGSAGRKNRPSDCARRASMVGRTAHVRQRSPSCNDVLYCQHSGTDYGKLAGRFALLRTHSSMPRTASHTRRSTTMCCSSLTGTRIACEIPTGGRRQIAKDHGPSSTVSYNRKS